MLGVVVALSSERKWITRPGPDVALEQCGVGASRAEVTARKLIDRGAKGLVSWGVAGGLDSDLHFGTVVVPKAVLTLDDQCVESDSGWRNRLVSLLENQVTTSIGPLIETSEIVSLPDDKREIHLRTQAVATDMESGAVARVAAETGVPWIAIRAIVDAAQQRLPAITRSAVDTSGNLRSSVFLDAMRRPTDWLAIFRLWRAAAAAGRSMRQVWLLSRPDLAYSAQIG